MPGSIIEYKGNCRFGDGIKVKNGVAVATIAGELKYIKATNYYYVVNNTRRVCFY